jgi:hypothetical protein
MVHICPVIAALYHCFLTTSPGTLLSQNLLNSSPYLFLPASTRLVSTILLLLETLHHEAVINISPDATSTTCIGIVVLLVGIRIFGLLLLGHGEIDEKVVRIVEGVTTVCSTKE